MMLLSLISGIIFLTITCYASRAETILYSKLLTGYNKFIRPVMNVSQPVRVEMKMHLQQIMALDGKNQIIELNAWLKFIWKDHRLSWDPKRFSNIDSIRFSGADNQIWRPDVLLYNSANEDFESTFKSNEVVYSSGEVNWVPPGIFRASCKMDITYFPFDDQTCFLKFASWTYQLSLLDLRFADDDAKGAVDLSTYTPSGEWRLMSVPAVRKINPSKKTGQPYPSLTFYLNLRRRTLFYLFNIVLPSMLISLMTLMGFCLPAHDMSEKIGFQTTILLSICFFVTIVSEMTPPTSESVPLLGVFFSTLTLIVSVSTAFTITVLNIRYRQGDNHHMSKTFYQMFLVWLPWILLMKRPGVAYRNKKEWKLDQQEPGAHNYTSKQPQNYINRNSPNDLVNFSIQKTISNAASDLNESGNKQESIAEQQTMPEDIAEIPLRKNRRATLVRSHRIDIEEDKNEERNSLPSEYLHLQRKVGEGIFNKRSELEKRDSINSMTALERIERIFGKCEAKSDSKMVDQFLYTVSVYYQHILESVKALTSEDDDEDCSSLEEWKFAAMALDRLCLVLFTFFIGLCVASMIIATPYFDA